MQNEYIARSLWLDIGGQHWQNLPDYFTENAQIFWPNTGERFDVEGFVRANSEYPGNWAVEVLRAETTEKAVVTVARVRDRESDLSFHAVSFFDFENGKISRLEEYWGDDGPPPAWRAAFSLANE